MMNKRKFSSELYSTDMKIISQKCKVDYKSFSKKKELTMDSIGNSSNPQKTTL